MHLLYHFSSPNDPDLQIPAFVKECIKGNPKDRNAAMDLITVTLPQKYVVRPQFPEKHVLNFIPLPQVPPSGKDGVKVEQSVRMGKKRAFDETLASDSETKATSVNDNEGIFVLHSYLFLDGNRSIS